MEDEYLIDEFHVEDEPLEDFQQEPEPEVKPQPEKKNGLLSRVLLFQVVVCMLLLASLGGLKVMVPEMYSNVSGQLQSALVGPDFKEGVKDVLNKITVFINSLTPIDGGKSQETPQEESSQASPQPSEADKANEQQNSQSYQPKADIVEHKLTQPAEGPISSPFGERVSPLDGTASDFHYGVDIAVGDGTSVAAMTDGVVSTTSSSRGSGNFLFITHPDGYESLYAHCSEILVEAGSDVTSGQIIALSGDTGLVTGPHLHFGVKKDGEWINPATLFPALA